MTLKKCAIMQPTYNPWLGYFDLIDQVDVFVFLDTVQLNKRSWQRRNRIKTPKGELFLTIPVKGSSREIIKNVRINNEYPWRKKHLKTIEINYRKAPYFEEVFPFIEEILNFKTDYLANFNINLIEKIAKKIGIRTKFIRASDLEPLQGKKDILLAEICKKINCNIYLSPQGSAVYLEANRPGGAIVENGIELYYHNYEHPEYPQLYPPFLPYMGIFDLLFNVGFNNALEIIRKGRREPIYYAIFREEFLKQIIQQGG